MRELIGQTLGQYQIVEKIGQGGMAAVFKARQPGLARWVAVKVLAPQFTADVDFSRYFLREAQTIAHLEHPHILPVYDFGQQGEYIYLVMRYIEGSHSLADVMSQSLLIEQALDYLKQIAAALDYAHDRGVIHRDIKPTNILLNDGWVFLADFGLARLMQSNRSITTGVSLGTPAYMSPEQGSGGKVEAATDVYAVGVITYAMLTGRIPHLAESSQAIIYKRNHEPAPSPREINPNIPASVDRCIQKGLAPNPAQRYRRTGAFVAALDWAVRESAAAHLRTIPIEKSDFVPPVDSAGSLPDLPPVQPMACPNCGLPMTPGSASCLHCGFRISTPVPSAAPLEPQRLWWLLGLAGVVGLVLLVVVGAVWLIAGQINPSQAQPDAAATVLVASTPVPGDILFFDDFAGLGLDRTLWASTSGGGQIQVYNSRLRLTSAGQSFPLVYSVQNPFPGQGNFRLNVSLHYLSAAERGSGLMLGLLPADFQQGSPKAGLLEESLIGLWQDSESWRIVTADEPEAYTQAAPHLDLTELQIDYINNIYQVRLNGQEIYTSNPTSTRPTVLWLGSPIQVESGGNWSGLEVEVISVERLPETIAALPTPTPSLAAPTEEPSPIPSPSPSPPLPPTTPAPLGQNCSTGAADPFAAAWEIHREQLGCPTGNLQVIPTIAEEAFQGGHLFWRSDTDQVYIILDRQHDGRELTEGQWQPAKPAWKWDGSDPDGVGLTPPSGLVEPKRGFGWLWRNHLGGAAGPLGWALDQEYGFDNMGQAQVFEAGLIFKGSGPRIYVLLEGGVFYTQ
jgi:serine/threonine protein kinase